MSIRGDTTAGAQIAHTASMHVEPDQSNAPAGSDTKSAAIAAVMKANQEAGNTQTAIYNASVDQLRHGLVGACQRVDAADQHGAAEVNNSGTRTT
jgi:hypothetical protein